MASTDLAARLAGLLPRRSDWTDARRSPGRDLVAGVTVAIVALPLALAFGVASGLGAQAGLATAVVAGVVAAVFGGSNLQVSGPTGAMTVVLLPGRRALRHRRRAHGRRDGGRSSSSSWRSRGSAASCATSRCRSSRASPRASRSSSPSSRSRRRSGSPARRATRSGSRPWTRCATFARRPVRGVDRDRARRRGDHARRRPRAPRGCRSRCWPSRWPRSSPRSCRSARDLLGAIPSGLPAPSLGVPRSRDASARCCPSALAIAALAALESLLSATVADGMSVNHTTDPDRELFGQGLANLAAPVFGGVPATGAIARTAVNVRAGASSKLSAVVHAVVLAVDRLLAGPAGRPHPARGAGRACCSRPRSGWSRAPRCCALARSTRGDAAVLALTFLVTVAFDLVTAVGVGVAVAVALALRAVAAGAPRRGRRSSTGDHRRRGAVPCSPSTSSPTASTARCSSPPPTASCSNSPTSPSAGGDPADVARLDDRRDRRARARRRDRAPGAPRHHRAALRRAADHEEVLAALGVAEDLAGAGGCSRRRPRRSSTRARSSTPRRPGAAGGPPPWRPSSGSARVARARHLDDVVVSRPVLYR